MSRTSPTSRTSWASLRAHRGALTGPALVLALAGALLSATGVLAESGLRAGPGTPAAGLLTPLAASFSGTALVVVVLVVAATVTLALRRRRRELALLGAVGATPAQVRRALTHELVLLTLLSAPLGAVAGLGLARLIRPLLTDAGVVDASFRFARSPLPALVAVALLLPVAVLAARLAARETLRLPPTAAVRATTSEERSVGRARRVLALVTAALGLVSAGSGAAVPGSIGSAGAATSGLLLVAAAAIAGPVLVGRLVGPLLDLTDRLPGARRAAPTVRLALANSRGFSRRLATVVVPLAAALAVGTIQSSVDAAASAAAVQQLRAGIRSDLVVASGGVGEGLSPQQVAAVAAADGVERATPIGAVTASVRTDDDEVPGLEALSWETEAMRVLPAGPVDPAFDPHVVAGSLADLARPGTVAVSSDARFESGHGLGDRVAVRLDDRRTVLRVVAVYDRGLGFGDYLTGAATPAALRATAPVDTVLVTTDGPVGDLGLPALAPAAYAERAVASAPQEQRLSLVLLLALLAFVGVGAADALVLSTAGRRDELALLARTGATGRQLVTMAAVESLVVAGVAWLVGTLAVVPSVLGASAGLLGARTPVADLATYGVLSLAVLGVAVLSVVPTAAILTSRLRRS